MSEQSYLVDSDGKPVTVPSDDEIEQIRHHAQGTALQKTCTDHPCEFFWADMCLQLLAAIDKSRRA